MVAQEAAEAVEETVEAVERISNLDLNGTTKRQQLIILGVTAVASAAASGGLTYFIANKRLRLKYEKIAQEEIAEAKRYYSAIHKTSTPEELAKDIPDEEKSEFAGPDESGVTTADVMDAVEDLSRKHNYAQSFPKQSEEEVVVVQQSLETIEEVPEPELKRNNVFKDSKSANSYYDYDEELAKRDPNFPYIITQEEFFQNETDFPQSTLTYFEGDGILVDEQERPIDDIDKYVGDGNLRFGHGSKDPNIVHVRNEVIDVDFEVVRSRGSYVDEVAGIVQHSETRGRSRRFRGDDE